MKQVLLRNFAMMSSFKLQNGKCLAGSGNPDTRRGSASGDAEAESRGSPLLPGSEPEQPRLPKGARTVYWKTLGAGPEWGGAR